MSDRYKIDSVNDTLKLTEDQFGRFLVDFAAWWALCKVAGAAGAEVVGLTWIDDDKPGQIHHVAVTDPKTGERAIWPGAGNYDACTTFSEPVTYDLERMKRALAGPSITLPDDLKTPEEISAFIRGAAAAASLGQAAVGQEAKHG